MKQAESQNEVYNTFINTAYIPVEIREITKQNNKAHSKKNEKKVLEFTQVMEQLINSGLSIKDALEISSLINKKNNTLEATLFEQIQKGVSFADAVQKLDNIFPPVYRGIISVGDNDYFTENEPSIFI